MRPSIIKALGFSLLATTTTMMIACGPDEPEAQPVDAQTMPQALTQHTEALAKGITDAAAFTAQTRVISTMLHLGVTESCGSETIYDDNGEIVEERKYCEPVEPYEIALDLDTPHQELSKLIKENILIPDNIEAQTATEITYLLKSQNVCATAENESERGDCVEVLDKMQVRLVVTSPAVDTFNVAVQTGVNRINPLNLRVAPDKLGLEGDLGAAKASLEQLKAAMNLTELELPASASGKISANIERLADKSYKATLATLAPVRITDAAMDIKLDVANPAATITLNGNTKQLTYAMDLAAIDIKLPFYEYTVREVEVTDEDGFTYTDYEQLRGAQHSAQLQLGGLSAQITLDGLQNTIHATDLGLGNATSRLLIDQEEVFSVELNPTQGRRVDLSVDDSGAKPILEIKPALDLKMIFAMAKLQDKLQDLDVPGWMLNDTLTIKADGANPIRIEPQPNDSLKVLAGALTFSSLTQQKTHNIQANQCFGPSDDDDVIITESEMPDAPEDDHIINLLAQRVCK